MVDNLSIHQMNMEKVCENGYQHYLRSRPGASIESVKRSKELKINEAGVNTNYANVNPIAMDLLTRMKNYRPQGVSCQLKSN